MGYNPYKCVVCGDVEDNGWNHKQHCQMIIYQNFSKCVVKNLSKSWCDDYGWNYDVCNKCFHNLGYSTDEDYGSDDEWEYFYNTVKNKK